MQILGLILSDRIPGSLLKNGTPPAYIRAVFMMYRAVAAVLTVVAMGFASGGLSAQDANRERPGAGTEITEAEAREFANAIAGAAQKGDIDQLNRLISWEEITDRATQIPNLPELEQARAGFKKGVMRRLQQSGGTFALINAEIKKGGAYRFVRANVKGKEPYVLFRLKVSNEGGLNYHQLFLSRKPDGRVVADDIYILLTGEKMSETLHRSWLPLATHAARANDKKGGPAAPALDAELQTTLKIVELNTQGKHAEALAEYKKAPESLRQNKNVLVIRLAAAQKVSDEEYARAIEDFRKFHPKDPALDFMLIDRYLIRKEYDESLGCVDRTIERLGADSALLSMKANIFVLMEKPADALRTIRQAMAAEPDLVDPFSLALDISIAAKDDDETASLLDVLESRFGYKWKDLREVAQFADFVKSPQYTKWAEAQKQK